MAAVGQTIVNPVTGEEITWRRVDADVLEWDDVWTRPGHRAAPHVHPGMEERWTVVEGRAAFLIGDEDERIVTAGDSIVAPAGVAHSGWNPTRERVVLRVTMTPALRWAEVTEQLFAWAGEGRTDDTGTPERDLLVGMLREYGDEVAPPPGVVRS